MATQLYLDITRFSRWTQEIFGRKTWVPICNGQRGREAVSVETRLPLFCGTLPWLGDAAVSGMAKFCPQSHLCLHANYPVLRAIVRNKNWSARFTVLRNRERISLPAGFRREIETVFDRKPGKYFFLRICTLKACR